MISLTRRPVEVMYLKGPENEMRRVHSLCSTLVPRVIIELWDTDGLGMTTAQLLVTDEQAKAIIKMTGNGAKEP